MSFGDEDPALVERLRAGDADAAAAFDQRYRRGLVRFCAGYLHSFDEAEDAVQEVFAKVLRSTAVPENPPENLRVWLYRIARNHCLNVLRGLGRRRDNRPLRSDVEIAASCTGLPTRLARQEDYQRIERLVMALSQSEREMIRMRYGEDLSREEIAAIVGVPVSTVKSRLFETMKKLRGRAGD